MTTTEDKLIDAFMDYPDGYVLPEPKKGYANSWSNLMPVVEKIESLGYMVYMQPYQCQIYTKSGNSPESFIIDADFKNTRLENTYEAVVSFIQWYNEQNKTS